MILLFWCFLWYFACFGVFLLLFGFGFFFGWLEFFCYFVGFLFLFLFVLFILFCFFCLFVCLQFFLGITEPVWGQMHVQKVRMTCTSDPLSMREMPCCSKWTLEKMLGTLFPGWNSMCWCHLSSQHIVPTLPWCNLWEHFGRISTSALPLDPKIGSISRFAPWRGTKVLFINGFLFFFFLIAVMQKCKIIKVSGGGFGVRSKFTFSCILLLCRSMFKYETVYFCQYSLKGCFNLHFMLDNLETKV